MNDFSQEKIELSGWQIMSLNIGDVINFFSIFYIFTNEALVVVQSTGKGFLSLSRKIAHANNVFTQKCMIYMYHRTFSH